jgi:peptide deformylase
MAHALEHEIDHLDGVLYIDRLVTPDSMWKLGEREGDDEETDLEFPELAETVAAGR